MVAIFRHSNYSRYAFLRNAYSRTCLVVKAQSTQSPDHDNSSEGEKGEGVPSGTPSIPASSGAESPVKDIDAYTGEGSEDEQEDEDMDFESTLLESDMFTYEFPEEGTKLSPKDRVSYRKIAKDLLSQLEDLVENNEDLSDEFLEELQIRSKVLKHFMVWSASSLVNPPKVEAAKTSPPKEDDAEAPPKLSAKERLALLAKRVESKADTVGEAKAIEVKVPEPPTKVASPSPAPQPKTSDLKVNPYALPKHLVFSVDGISSHYRAKTKEVLESKNVDNYQRLKQELRHLKSEAGRLQAQLGLLDNEIGTSMQSLRKP